jgi:hypothetical protein
MPHEEEDTCTPPICRDFCRNSCRGSLTGTTCHMRRRIHARLPYHVVISVEGAQLVPHVRIVRRLDDPVCVQKCVSVFRSLAHARARALSVVPPTHPLVNQKAFSVV